MDGPDVGQLTKTKSHKTQQQMEDEEMSNVVSSHVSVSTYMIQMIYYIVSTYGNYIKGLQRK